MRRTIPAVLTMLALTLAVACWAVGDTEGLLIWSAVAALWACNLWNGIRRDATDEARAFVARLKADSPLVANVHDGVEHCAPMMQDKYPLRQLIASQRCAEHGVTQYLFGPEGSRRQDAEAEG